jgi:hypothetical protein
MRRRAASSAKIKVIISTSGEGPWAVSATTQMKQSLLILSMLLISCFQPLAEQDDRFVEFPGPAGTTRTYDLKTVQVIQPGKFTIISTLLANADVMRFELKVLDTLQNYCKRPDGNYAPSTDVFTLGQPDMPIKSIEVKTSQTKLRGTFKEVSWHYPYARLATELQGRVFPAKGYFWCKHWEGTEAEFYTKRRTRIMNGIRFKEVFDCKRGLTGDFMSEEDDPSKVTMGFVRPHSFLDQYYRGVCLRVTHETPYSPE